jgi:hypothetical protein
MPKPMKKGSIFIPWRTTLGPACYIVLEKNDRSFEYSMYLVTLIQHMKQPRPTKNSKVAKRRLSLKRLMKLPTTCRIFDMRIMIDQ